MASTAAAASGRDATAAAGGTSVVKKIAADQPGAQRWLRRYGERLVCVRYRDGRDGEERFVTVELIVDRRPRTARSKEPLAVRIERDEVELRQRAKAAGARFDWTQRLWLLPRDAVARLGLQRRVVCEGGDSAARVGKD
jgi:hypothetical protein